MIKIKNLNESYSALITKPNSIMFKISNILKARPNNYQFDMRYKTGVWDGYNRYFTVKNGYMIYPRGFNGIIEDFANNANVKLEYDNLESIEYNKDEVKEFIDSLNLKFEPRHYQKKAVHLALYKGRGVFEMATGSGKSLTQAIIASYLYFKKNIKVVLIVPNISLVEQFYSDFLDYFENSQYNIKKYLHKIYGGKEIHFDKPITITTWQSIYKKKELFKEIGCIIVDEVQKAQNFESKLTEILIPASINVKYKFGFTGSIPKEKVAKLSIIGAIGKIYTIIKTKQLIDMGLGTPIEIILTFLNHQKELCTYVRQLNYQNEKKFFEELEKRTEFITSLAKKVSNQYGNTLILFDRIKHGYSIINKLVGNFLPKLNEKIAKTLDNNLYYVNTISEKEEKIIKKYNLNIKSLEEENVFFIYGAVDAEIREEIRKKVENKNNCIIVANYATFSTGINIKNLHNLIFASSIKSFTTIIQSLGRTIRKHTSKEKVRVFDIIDDCSTGVTDNYMMKHFKERIDTYISEEHSIKEKRIDFKLPSDIVYILTHPDEEISDIF